jgi:UDP-N-acetylglucosamine diphosphorylase / glucose-1-phosphate thymidylyltransferase / UDP-N-acetylgalactosamine diphosphorylase / glucosamine-1-phosphate N-acetyltransferase / galactosamine-1-phosphate N-acetyltransferase
LLHLPFNFANFLSGQNENEEHMQAVILAAGKGTRMGHLTVNTPKPLLRVHNQTLIERVICALPRNISELVVVVGYLGDQIRDTLGSNVLGRKVVYVEQTLPGTGGALLSTKPYLNNEFMVINSDDIYSQADLERLISERIPSQGIVHRVQPTSSAESILIDKDGNIVGRIKVGPLSLRWFGTGAFFLNNKLWEEEFVRPRNSEYSLPHTVAKAKFKVRTVVFKDWLPMNTPEELRTAESWLGQA